MFLSPGGEIHEGYGTTVMKRGYRPVNAAGEALRSPVAPCHPASGQSWRRRSSCRGGNHRSSALRQFVFAIAGHPAIDQFETDIQCMNKDNEVSVFFICPRCRLPYRATQKQMMVRMSGSFQCAECDRTVHEWSGFYNFSDWQPVRMKPARLRKPL